MSDDLTKSAKIWLLFYFKKIDRRFKLPDCCVWAEAGMLSSQPIVKIGGKSTTVNILPKSLLGWLANYDYSKYQATIEHQYTELNKKVEFQQKVILNRWKKDLLPQPSQRAQRPQRTQPAQRAQRTQRVQKRELPPPKLKSAPRPAKTEAEYTDQYMRLNESILNLEEAHSKGEISTVEYNAHKEEIGKMMTDIVKILRPKRS